MKMFRTLSILVVFACVNLFAQYQDKTNTKEFHLQNFAPVAQVTNATINTSIPGTRTLVYWIVSTDANGNKSLPSGPFVANHSPAQLGAVPDGSYYFNSANHKLYVMTSGSLVEFTAATYTYGTTLPGGPCTAGVGFVNTLTGALYLCTPPAPNSWTFNQPVLMTFTANRYMNTITWTPANGIVSYDVLRTTTKTPPSATCNCAVATGLKNTQVTDKSETLTSYTVTTSGSDFVETNELNATGLSTKTTRYNGSIVFSVDANGNIFAKGNVSKPSYTLGLTECFFNAAFGVNKECPGDVGNKAMSGGLIEQYITDLANPSVAKTYVGQEIYQEALSGGKNQGSAPNTKTNYNAFKVGGRFYTPGQHNPFGVTASNNSHGDTFGVSAQVYCAGNISALGDEGCVGMSSYSYQMADVFGATVASVTGNEVYYTGAAGGTTIGELRYLIVTNRGVYSTGTISGISTVTVTGSGTNFASLCPGGTAPCDPVNLFFSLDGGNSYSSHLYVIRVGHITSATSLTLNWDNELGGSWQGNASTGTYKIFKGSTVTAITKLGHLTVVDGSQFQASDAIQSPLGNSNSPIGMRVQTAKYVPGGYLTSTAQFTHLGPQPLAVGIGVYGKYGNLSQMTCDTGYTCNGHRFLGDVRSLVKAETTPDDVVVTGLSINQNAADAGSASINYDKAGKQWQIMKGSVRISTSVAAGSNGVLWQADDSAGAPRMIVKEGLSGFAMGKPTYWWSDNQGTMTAEVFGNTGAAIFRDVKLTGAAQPACNSSNRGQFWYAPGATSVKDSVAVCAKDAADAYAWRTIY